MNALTFVSTYLLPLQWQSLPEDDTPPFVFPDADLINSLASLYFTHVNAYFPILHEPSFFRSISLDLHREDRHFGALVLAVCSLGARFSHDERIYEDGVNQSHEMGSTHGASEQSIGWKWIRQIQPVRRTFTTPPSLYEIQLYQVYHLGQSSFLSPKSYSPSLRSMFSLCNQVPPLKYVGSLFLLECVSLKMSVLIGKNNMMQNPQ